MSGLSLRTGMSAGASYTPMTPASATAASASGSSIGQMAYGISGSGDASNRAVAGYGSVTVGVVAIAALIYFWWSLPR